MGFIREYGILIAIILTLSCVGYVWHERGVLDNGKTVSDTEKFVEPIQQKEFKIGENPLTGVALLNVLRKHKY